MDANQDNRRNPVVFIADNKVVMALPDSEFVELYEFVRAEILSVADNRIVIYDSDDPQYLAFDFEGDELHRADIPQGSKISVRAGHIIFENED